LIHVEVLTAAVDDVHPDVDAAVRDQDLALTRRRSVTIIDSSHSRSKNSMQI
jgi:hypothetical protein